MTRRIVAAAVLALPLVVLVAMVAQAEWAVRQGTVITVPIAGYDPQDVLRGHFLRYRIVWNWAGSKPRAAQAICVERGGADPPVRPIAAGQDCPLTLRAGVDAVAFMPAGISDQLFIPEQSAASVAANPNAVVLDLAVRSDGSARLLRWRMAP